jgi:trehalose 6-phosphate phosphatase
VRNILTRAARPTLERVAAAKVLIALDYDGTLAPIVADRDAAHMRPQTRKLLTRLAALYPSAIITGRQQRDVERFVAGTGVKSIVGNHGADWGWTRAEEVSVKREVQTWRFALNAQVGRLPGVEIEDKAFSLAVHYRASREKRRAEAAIAEALRTLPNVRVTVGKQVVNLVPRGAPHKGLALRHLRDTRDCDTAIFIGDDVTDEDVFALDEPGQLLSVRVGRSRESRAPWFIPDQRHIDDLLALLIDIRTRNASLAA